MTAVTTPLLTVAMDVSIEVHDAGVSLLPVIVWVELTVIES